MKKSTQKISDALLVLEYQSGNKKALAVLVKRWHTRLCKQAYWHTKNVDQAQDIVQDAWSTIVSKLTDLRDPNSFGGWALTIVNHKALDKFRKHKPETKLTLYREPAVWSDTLVDQEAYSTREKQLEEIQQAIKNLPIDQQMVLNLFYMEELSLKQISKITGVTVGTVKSRLFHAREKLKKIVKVKTKKK